MWCRCLRGWKQSGYVQQPDSDLWVHSACMLPAKMVFEKVTDMLAPKNATGVNKVIGRDTGIFEITFFTTEGKTTVLAYHPYPRKVGMDQGRGILLSLWQKLDDEVDLLNDPSGMHQEYHKNRARAFAESLALMMQPFFTSADDIVREAVWRHKCRTEGTEHETPGLAEEVWDPTKNWDGTDRVLAGAGPAGSVRPDPTPVSPEEREAIKNALAAGTFSVEKLAELFKKSPAVIEACRG
jgi:hypothetical protein